MHLLSRGGYLGTQHMNIQAHSGGYVSRPEQNFGDTESIRSHVDNRVGYCSIQFHMPDQENGHFRIIRNMREMKDKEAMNP